MRFQRDASERGTRFEQLPAPATCGEAARSCLVRTTRFRDAEETELGRWWISMDSKLVQFSVINRRRLRPQNYKCPQCPKAFTSKQHRTVHVRVIHEKRRDYGCGTCGQTFSRKSAQVSHVRYVHEGRRDHECPICKVRFGRKNGLNKHVVAVHWKRRTFKCDCGAAFTRKDCLLRHQRGVHDADSTSRQGDLQGRALGGSSMGDVGVQRATP